LKGDVASVALGAGDIFDLAPYEVLSTEEGYAGTKHKFGCALTKLGYVFADVTQGKIFLHTGEGLDEISRYGLRQFWRDHIRQDLPDNPFQGNGVSFGYDEKFNRLIVSVKDQTNNKFITASYSPQAQSWVSFHDYSPLYMVTLRSNRLVSLNGNVDGTTSLFTHNTGAYGKYYDQTVTFPLLIDVVYNEQAYLTKYFTAIDWVTQSFDANNRFLKDDTFNFLTANSDNKTTGRLQIIPHYNLADIYDSNSRLLESKWSYNKLRDVANKDFTGSMKLDFYNNFQVNPAVINNNLDWYDQGKMVDNYLTVRLEYSNLNNNKFLFLDHDVIARQSFRN
jgi:hypothetical protein